MNMMEVQQFMEAYSGAFIGLVVGLGSALLSVGILAIAIRWCIFKKAGQKGWKALIPVYSDYIYYKIAWSGRVFVTLILCAIGSVILSALVSLLHEGVGLAVTAICSAGIAGAYAVIGLKLHFKMAHAFGRSDYFAVGLYLLNGLFTAILAFGDARYKEQKSAPRMPREAAEAHEYVRPAPRQAPQPRPVEHRQMYASEQPVSYAPAQQTEYAYQPRAQYQPAGQRPVRRAVRNAENQE